jgi:hypothetical protein
MYRKPLHATTISPKIALKHNSEPAIIFTCEITLNNLICKIGKNKNTNHKTLHLCTLYNDILNLCSVAKQLANFHTYISKFVGPLSIRSRA